MQSKRAHCSQAWYARYIFGFAVSVASTASEADEFGEVAMGSAAALPLACLRVTRELDGVGRVVDAVAPAGVLCLGDGLSSSLPTE